MVISLLRLRGAGEESKSYSLRTGDVEHGAVLNQHHALAKVRVGLDDVVRVARVVAGDEVDGERVAGYVHNRAAAGHHARPERAVDSRRPACRGDGRRGDLDLLIVGAEQVEHTFPLLWFRL